MAHHPAAFINAIAEEGNKAEAIEWLQNEYNENCELRKICADLLDLVDALPVKHPQQDTRRKILRGQFDAITTNLSTTESAASIHPHK